jgi:anti-sigma regulatory factor (Ser/Thr protein kinase)
MGSGLWSADQLLRPPAPLPADEQADAAAPADPEPAADQRLIPALSSWARAFPGVPRQVKAARHFVAALLDGSPRRDDAVIVISELFTNALQHTRSGQPGGLVVVQVSRWRQGVRIAVTDQGSAKRPVIKNARSNSDDPSSVSANMPLTDSAAANGAFTGGVFPGDALIDEALADEVLAGEVLADRLLAGGIFPDDLLADGVNHFPADCGRGLHMVSCLAEHLDWHDDARGRTVHAVLGRR